MENENQYPYIVFDVAGNLFSVNSLYNNGIVQLGEYTRNHTSKGAARGMMQYWDRSITLFDLRTALGLGSLEDEYDEFCQMIDARKDDHERWVAALEKTAKERAPFTLATDPHKCALGKWRDAFKTDIDEVNFRLNQLDTPHTALHKSAGEILALQKRGNTLEIEKAVLSIYNHVHDVFMPSVLSMLDDLKQVFRSSVFREMVLMLKDPPDVGIIVENIRSVEYLSELCDATLLRKFSKYNYITSIKRGEHSDDLIANIDMNLLLKELCAGECPTSE